MPPYEMLYDHHCRTPNCWLEAGENQFAGPKIIQMTAEKVAIEREKLKAARDRQKMYADPHRCSITFNVGDRVYLKVSPWKGVIRFGKRDPPSELADIHNTFNVCYLRKCKVDDETQILPIKDLKVDLSNKLVEEPIRVVDRKVTKLRKKEIPVILVE
ncbi:uncharacterized protein [Rutidosis leptorrhynchoides]|uniref:uncharacterized protein n=1 Tax=Rutidosis leptorrhynchoides TaxID=125765 RepID=UPI003A9A5D75